MSRLVYKYKIIDVDYEAKNMEIVYHHVDYGTINIGARLPYEGESIEQIIDMYAPIAIWLEHNKKPIEVSVGLSGMSSTLVSALEKPSWLSNRLSKYGSVETQIEFITENGLEAWQSNVAAIKKKYPKPV